MFSKYLFLLSFLLLFVTGYGQEQVLMQVGKSTVTVDEFKYIYEKNNGSNADYSEKSISEYLDLYTRFKLKVEKAKQLQLDTISELITELDGYRKQLAGSYLIDKEVTDFLLRELYDRMKYDVEFSHIFIPVAETASKVAKEEAKNTIRDIKSKIVGGMSFEEAAKMFSQDKTTADKGGAMGYFTAKLPSGFYELESALYQTKVGNVSDIVESKIGYHLVKVTNQRPARGTIEVAHILFKNDQYAFADSIYRELLKGKDFDVYAMNFSADRATSKNGGKLPPFGINTYDKKFEDAAFALTLDGDISKPVFTQSGWHIIKRLSKQAPDSYDLFVRKMKAQINKDQRFDAAKLKLISDIKKASGFKEDKAELQKYTASLNEEIYSYKWSPDSLVSQKMLFSFGGNKVYTVKDFANFCKKNTKTRLKYDKSKPINELVDEIYIEYVNEAALAFEEQSLDSKYPDFKSLMREYEEGILLFEATKINVWDKANQDTVGLKLFYADHKSNYFWPEKAKVSLFEISGVNEKAVTEIHQYASKNATDKLLKKYNKKNIAIKVSDAEYEKGAKELMDTEWKKGRISSLKTDSNASAYRFLKINELIPSKQKTLAEAKGYVVADYQDFLEKQWLESLTREFKVVIYTDVFEKLKK